jgi:membrane-associated phospholipid phosphatase
VDDLAPQIDREAFRHLDDPPQEMKMTRTFKIWVGTLLLTALFALISVTWLDKPIAILVHELSPMRQFPHGIAQSPAFSIPLASAVIFVIFGLAAMMEREFSKLETAILLCDISLLATDAIKDQLKSVFGRTWPDSWDPGISSLIRDNEFRFNFFHPGQMIGSFPSGHAAGVAAVMSVLWIAFPHLRWTSVICIAVADVGLVLLNLHFLSDVVVGTFVGASTGFFTVALCAPKLLFNSLTP